MYFSFLISTDFDKYIRGNEQHFFCWCYLFLATILYKNKKTKQNLLKCMYTLL